jgi:dATP pyrophosphohydrolase
MSARIRTDVVDVYIVRRSADSTIEFLQLRRVEEPLRGTWQPIMGHVHDAETSSAAAMREMLEEVGLRREDTLVMWALEQVHPYYIARLDAVMLTPRFAALVPQGWTPRLNEEHDAFRWIPQSNVAESFVWPGQRACCTEIVALVLSPESPASLVQRIAGVPSSEPSCDR